MAGCSLVVERCYEGSTVTRTITPSITLFAYIDMNFNCLTIGVLLLKSTNEPDISSGFSSVQLMSEGFQQRIKIKISSSTQGAKCELRSPRPFVLFHRGHKTSKTMF